MDQDVEMKVEVDEAGQESLFERAKRNLTALELDSDWIKLLRWIQKGTSKDDKRPRLQCILSSKDRIESTDGFCILRAKFNDPERQLIPEGTWKIQSIVDHLVILDKVDDANYPNIMATYPLTDGISQNMFNPYDMVDPKGSKVTISIAFNPELIKKISFPGRQFQLYLGAGIPNFDFGSIFGSFGHVYLTAALMPMHSSDDGTVVSSFKNGLRFVK